MKRSMDATVLRDAAATGNLSICCSVEVLHPLRGDKRCEGLRCQTSADVVDVRAKRVVLSVYVGAGFIRGGGAGWGRAFSALAIA